jgi:type VI secretion system protein ImpB
VAKQVTPIRKLLEVRQALANLRSNLAGNDKLGTLLQEVLNNTKALQQLSIEAGLQPKGSIESDSKKED